VKEVEAICGSSEQEGVCLSCGRRPGSNASAPLPLALVKLQEQHASILQQIQLLRKNGQGTNRTRTEKGHASQNPKIHRLTRLTELIAQHQREEERVLTPIVDKYIDSGISETIRRGHGETWEALQQLNLKLLEVNGAKDSQRLFFDSSIEFEAMLREQFSREENVIYWFASLCLSQPNSQNREKEVFEDARQKKQENPSET